MTTIGDLRDALRIELHDEDEERWQDDVLDRHLQRAARELAFVWPREQKTTLSTTSGSRDLSLSSLSDLVRILAVEYPVGQYPPAYVQFSRFGDTLTLLVEQTPGDGEDVAVYWGSLHALDSMTSTLPPAAEDAVITGAAAFAAIEWASFATNRANVAGADAVSRLHGLGRTPARALPGDAFALRRQRPPALRRAYSRLSATTPSQSVVRWEP